MSPDNLVLASKFWRDSSYHWYVKPIKMAHIIEEQWKCARLILLYKILHNLIYH